MLTIRVCVLLFIAVVLVSSQAVAQDTTPNTNGKSTKRLMWAAESFGKVSIATSLEQLHMALYNAELLPVRLYEGNKSRYVSAILEELRLTPIGTLPVGIDSVLCDLNAHVCSREREPIPEADIGDPTKHIGGFKPSKGKWSNRNSQDLYVPDLDMLWSIEFKPVDKPEGTSAFDLMEEIGPNCRDYIDIPCEDLVRALNSHAPSSLTKHVKSRPILPTLRVITTIPLSGVESVTPSWSPQSLKQSQRHDTEAIARFHSDGLFDNTIDLFSDDPRAFLADRNTRDRPFSDTSTQASPTPVDLGSLLPNALRDNLFSIGTPKPNSHEGEPNYQQQAQLLKSISHPYKDSNEFPDRLRASVPVGILDFWLDQGHCDLPPSCKHGLQTSSPAQCIDVPFSVDRTAITDRAETCGEISQQMTVSRDHAVHITGLIVSAVNDKGIVGLNPYAKIIFHEINPDKIQEIATREDLAKQTTMVTGGILISMAHTKVINVSWFYDAVPTNDAFLRVVEGGLSGKLLVVAAGNDSIEVGLDSACEMQPACAGLSNIITVAGLNTDVEQPDIWKVNEEGSKEGSNFGERFDIAAVAENVLSTSSADHVGFLSGTSQAAPQVTAAASLLYSIHEKNYKQSIRDFSPVWVKNRLMYTADIFPHLLDKVKSGRLNINRAISVDQAIFQYTDDEGLGTTKVAQGTPIFLQQGFTLDTCGASNRQACESDVVICRLTNGDELAIPTRGIRRMFWNSVTKRYVVFFNNSRERQDVELKRITDCGLRSLMQRVYVETDSGPVTFEFRRVKNYVSAMF